MRLSKHRIHKIIHKLRHDHVSAYAGQSAYFTVLSVIPFLLFLLTLIQHLPIELKDILDTLYYIIPESYEPLIQSVFYDIHVESGKALLSVSLIITIWTAGKGTLVLSNGLNTIYDLEDDRNYFELRIKAMLYTILFALVIVFTMLFLVFGNRIYNLLYVNFVYLSRPAHILTMLRTFVAFGIFFIIFTLFYTFLPARHQHVTRQLPGAVFTSFSWMISAYIFSLYVDSSSMNSYMYGSLSYIILFLIYLYLLMYLFFIGAVINFLFMTYVSEDDY